MKEHLLTSDVFQSEQLFQFKGTIDCRKCIIRPPNSGEIRQRHGLLLPKNEDITIASCEYGDSGKFLSPERDQQRYRNFVILARSDVLKALGLKTLISLVNIQLKRQHCQNVFKEV